MSRNNAEHGELVCPWDDIQEQNSTNGRLVEEELKSVDVVFPLVGRDPNGVDSAAEDAY